MVWPRGVHNREEMLRRHGRHDDIVEEVFDLLRPPDAVDEEVELAEAAHELQAYSWAALLSLPDFLDSLEPQVESRAFLGPLLCLNHDIRRTALRHTGLRYLGLFRTAFGVEHGCRLYAHQLRSLGVMHAAEHPAGWEFGQMRGGILGDDPGLGKTVTMLALIVSTIGVPPERPRVFWDATGWPALRTNPTGLQQLLKLTNYLRTVSPHHPKLWKLAAFANRAGAAADYPTIEEFDSDVEEVVGAVIASRGGHEASIEAIRSVREPVRLHMIAVREGLDPRHRSFIKSTLGKRVALERKLVCTPATLVVVPMALLEHWFEQLRRHVDYRALSRDGAGHGCAVWIDGLGDAALAPFFSLPPKQRLDAWPALPDEYMLGSCSIVLTSYERCQYEYVHRTTAASEPGGDSSLMKLRWLRLVVDEGHELGHNEAAGWSDKANRFIATIAAERRWVMSGTPVGARGKVAQLWQLQRLLAFLREPNYGVVMRVESPYLEPAGKGAADAEAEGERAFARLIVRPAAADDTRKRGVARSRLEGTLKPLMVRHRKCDLQLPEPIFLPPYVATLSKLPDEEGTMLGQRHYTNRVCTRAADHVAAVMDEARHAWSSCSLGPEPKAVVFSEFDNDLSQVSSCLVASLGNEAVAEHWGAYRSTELARFRHGRQSCRVCPRCGFENDLQVEHHRCDRFLFEVVLEGHGGAPLNPDADPSAEQWASTWLVEEERLYITDGLGGAYRQWHVSDFDRYRDPTALTPAVRNVWVSTAPLANSKLPTPRWPGESSWPADHSYAEVDAVAGGPGGNKLPAKLRGWAKCGKWCAPQRACPPCWSLQQPAVPFGSAPILLDAAWREKQTQTYILTLREDGSHGLDLSFVTHLFLVNPIDDQARLSQVVARAHRMGATGPVTVEPIVLWDD